MVELRRLERADAEAYRGVRLAALVDAPRAFGATYEAEAALDLSVFEERLERSVVLGAWVGTALVGTVFLRREERPKEVHKATLGGFYVAPSWRRQGIADGLLAAVIQAARGEVEQILLTVTQGNNAAIALYERSGFVTYGVEPRACRDDDGYSDKVLMVLRLDTPPPRS